jgi:hypothetical protein
MTTYPCHDGASRDFGVNGPWAGDEWPATLGDLLAVEPSLAAHG